VFCFCPVSKNERYDAAAGPEVDHAVIFFHAGKPREQDGIERKPVSFLLLANYEPSVEKGVSGLWPFFFRGLRRQKISSSG
jgi:hypothetical protein